MNTELLFHVTYAVLLVGGFVMIPCLGEVIFDVLYRVSPRIRRWWDNYCEGLPDYDDEV